MCESRLKEICKNCGFTRNSHSASEYHSLYYTMYMPYNCCPGHEDCMEWKEGTTFEHLEDKEEK